MHIKKYLERNTLSFKRQDTLQKKHVQNFEIFGSS